MISSLNEINERYEKIKDHKPKAAKKLNELGEILSSAYKIDKHLANDMWQYIIDLNTSEDISNSKFYIAQVFNKISDRLSSKEATNLISMNSTRVRNLILYGYDGFKLWDCLETLICGYLEANSLNEAVICTEYFYEKFNGINSEQTEIYRIARKVATICVDYIKNNNCVEESLHLIDLLSNTNNQDVNSIIEITKEIGITGVCEDFDMLFYVTSKCKESYEFFNLLWEARNQFSLEELRFKLLDYIESCEENDKIPYSYITEDENNPPKNYEESKLYFYNELVKNDDSLLSIYFTHSSHSLITNIIMAWIYDNNWEYFIKYISQYIFENSNSNVDDSLKLILNHLMKFCFYDEGMDSYDRFNRSYKTLMLARANKFAESLANISVITIGAPCHKDFLYLIKDFIFKLYGNLDILNNVGFEEKIDNRSPIIQLKDYIRKFKKTGELIHQAMDTEYEQLMDNFVWSYWLDEDANKILNQTYKFAKDDEISTFFFMHTKDYLRCKDMLSACIRKNDVDRGIKLIDMMIATKDYPDYNNLNGRGRMNMLILKELIHQFDYSLKHSSDSIKKAKTKGITDSMREVAKQLVERMIPFLPNKLQEQLKLELYLLVPTETKEHTDSFEYYIENLLNTIDLYTNYLKTGINKKLVDINKTNALISQCFKKLSSNDRLDIIIQIMKKLLSVKNQLLGVTYSYHVIDLVKGIKPKEFTILYNNYFEIFDEWIKDSTLKNHQIISFASAIGEYCSKDEFISFRNMVLLNKGFIEGIDNCFKVTSQNTTSQLLYNSKKIVIELDYIKIVDSRAGTPKHLISNTIIRLLTKRKSKKIDSVRLTSCKINNIIVADTEIGFICNFDDGGPITGYNLYDSKSIDELIIYPNFFATNNIKHINNIEMSFILMDENIKTIEILSPIVINYNYEYGNYDVIKQAVKEE